MKVSLNWIKEYLDFDLPEVNELVERIGSQLGAVEGVENLGEKYKGIVIAEVVSCVDHPDSDHMQVCKLDDGGKAQDVDRDENGYVQVVCGAANVRQGIMVAWLPPGSIVPESLDKEPFVLGTRELRGVKSNGMLASQRELSLGDNHEGILEINSDEWSPKQSEIKPGADFASVFSLNDYIIDIENKMFTHRPDCFGHLGVAREIAGILGHQFTSPKWYSTQSSLPECSTLDLEVVNEDSAKIPRLMAVAMKNITIKPSPLWLQIALARVGAKSINNVVDATNYIMLLTAQPTHAYDYDKLQGHKLIARMAHSGEKVKLLNHKTYQLEDTDIVMADSEGPVGLAGIMGGGDSEVSQGTTNIVLEVANFDMYTVRRSSMKHGVFTDALTRFNKGQSPLQNPYVLNLLVRSVQDVAGGEQASTVNDAGQPLADRTWVHPPVPVTADFINTRLGLDLTSGKVAELLRAVECEVDLDTSSEGSTLTITAPFWRTDIETREDVVEEVGRLYGFDKLPLKLPKKDIAPASKDPLLDLKSQVRSILAKAGANEVLTYSFVHGDLLKKAGQDPTHAFQVGNALSPDLQYYRLSLTPSLLDKIHPNIKAGYDRFALFEIGKGHNLGQFDEDGLPREFEMLDLVFAASDKVAGPGAAFYEARAFLINLAKEFGIELEFRPIEHEEEYQTVKPYDHARSAKVFVRGTELPLGMIGEYKASVRRSLKLPVATAGFGIGLQQLMQASIDHYVLAYRPLPRFPKVTQDITLKVPDNVSFSQLYLAACEGLEAADPQHTHYRFDALDIYETADGKFKHFTFRLQIASYQRTLTDNEVHTLLDSVTASAATVCQAERL